MLSFKANWKVLVLDDESTRIISSSLTMFDIMERRITLVEKLSQSRQPFPEMEVIYFITPTEESVGFLLGDFAPKKKSMYVGIIILIMYLYLVYITYLHYIFMLCISYLI